MCVKLTQLDTCTKIADLRLEADDGVKVTMASKTSKLDQAFKHFHEKNYKKAAELFEKVLEDDDNGYEVKGEAGKFLSICNRQLEAESGEEENSLKFVSYYMNVGEYEKATGILSKMDASPGTAEFLLAEMAMEREDEEEACKLLVKAIEANADNRGYALNSIVFAPHLTKGSFDFLHKKDKDSE